ncbi:O-antigen polymerase [Winogradskyella haliclonae]|uniref:O-antigen polymerase n=1 Tax=Winogradskyella haliclonae TaxID=2048558 RepID=A0ABQ2BWZ1_9FLAO|nr:O-antigen polymerase [Winogradskyella haliclonae]
MLLFLYYYKIVTYPTWNYFAYLNDSKFDFSFFRFLIVVPLFFFNLRTLLKLDKEKIIFAIAALLFMLLTIPSLISAISKNLYPLKLLIYHQALFLAVVYFSRVKIPLHKIPTVNKKQALLILFLLCSLGIIPYLIAYGPYINLKNLLLIDVYETRLNVRGINNPYFGYTYSLYTKILLPLLIVFALELKKWWIAIIGVLYVILFYLFGAHKTVYLGLIVILIFYRFTYLKTIIKLIKISNILIVISAVLAFFKFDYLWILLFRRVHFTPAILDLQYLQFFEGKHTYWSQSFLNFIKDYPFEKPYTKLIGEYYFKNPDMNANNGLISEGFMNFGSIGVLVNILIVSVYFMILSNLNIKYRYFGIYLLVVLAFISSSTLTVLLTHGAFALLILSIFLLNEKEG